MESSTCVLFTDINHLRVQTNEPIEQRQKVFGITNP